MAITERLKGIAVDMQDSVKDKSTSLLHFLVRLVTGMLIGLTFSLIGQEVFQYSSFMLLFVIIVISGLVLKFLVSWSLPKIMVFDLICILVAMLFRMYILIAPSGF